MAALVLQAIPLPPLTVHHKSIPVYKVIAMQTPFSSLLPPLPTPEEMQLWDRVACEKYHIPPLILMENAARGVMEELHQHHHLAGENRILIVMGKGNNGGDGAALARLLHDEGHNVLLLSVAPLDELPSPAREHTGMALATGVPFQVVVNDAPFSGDDSGASIADAASFLPTEWLAPHVVVDALCGTGLHGNLRPLHLTLVRLINALAQHAFVLSIDIPSGLHGISGSPMPEAVHANLTVCLEAGKPGLFSPEAAPFTGQTVIRRVGIPREVRKSHPASWRLLAPAHGSYPPPSRLRHKGDGGRVCIIGGSKGMSGAPLLAAHGALRAGAGLVHMLVPAGLEEACRSNLPEVMAHGMGSLDEWSSGALDQISQTLETIRPDSLLIGPGMGRTRGVRQVLAKLLAQKDRVPAVLDADALFFLRFGEDAPDEKRPVSDCSDAKRLVSGYSDAARLASDCSDAARLAAERTGGLVGENDILTPHPLEMARLLPPSLYAALGFSGPAKRDCQAAQAEDMTARTRFVQEHRAEVLQRVIAGCAGTLVFKGPGTLVGTASHPIALSPVATAVLGVAGSGDVLAGVCAALLASGLAGHEAACLGVYLHAYAGKLLSRKAPLGHTARDIASAIPLAWANICSR